MTRLPIAISLGKSPLTDLRSVGSSALFHVLLVLLASLTAGLSAAFPVATSRPKALYAENDPVDNRVECSQLARKWWWRSR